MRPAVLLVPALLLAGCSSGHQVLGAGDATSLCGAVREYNALAEPDVTSRSAVLAHVDAVVRILDRVDGGRADANHSKPPPTVLDEVKAERAAYTQLRKDVSAATTPDALHSVVSALATSNAFAATDTGVELWASNNCG